MQQSLLPFVLQGNASLSPPNETIKEKQSVHIPQSRMSSSYSVPIAGLSATELQRHKRELTMIPQDFGYNQSPSFNAFQIDDTRLYVPRFYGYSQWGRPDEWNVTEGQEMDVKFVGVLNPVQKEATAAALIQLNASPHGALLVLPCGYGKTVCALFIAHKLRKRTLVLVHKGFLVQQWHERAKTFLPNASLGIIQQNKVDGEADIVVGMVQSISKREYAEDILEKFGTVIIDEAHHMSAPVFSRALHCLPAKYILGLSATPERRDGMTCLLYYSMGAICHRIERKPEHTMVSCMLYEEGKRREIKYKNGQISMPLMLNALVADATRNDCIASHIVKYLQNMRHVIVLTDRIVQLHSLRELLVKKGVDSTNIGYYIGTTSISEREHSSKLPCILSTYSMAKEGLDIPRLDTLVMATPKGDIVQASGRVQRKDPNKRVPLIVDIVDTFSVFEALRWKRWHFYRHEKFCCQTFDIRDDAQWFV
jgi:superfamily II DNA or RNA helicase